MKNKKLSEIADIKSGYSFRESIDCQTDGISLFLQPRIYAMENRIIQTLRLSAAGNLKLTVF